MFYETIILIDLVRTKKTVTDVIIGLQREMCGNEFRLGLLVIYATTMCFVCILWSCIFHGIMYI